jgi:isopentenyldiphosphate isomerase
MQSLNKKKMKKEEYFDIVDDNDNVLYVATRKETREKNLLHRGTAVLVKNPKGEILVHKRTETKDLFPGYYDFWFGGGLNSREDYKKGALRELKEEAGIAKVNLEFLFKHKYEVFPRCFIAVYECVSDGPFKFQKSEVAEAYFLSMDELKKRIKTDKFCPDGVQIFERYLKLKKQI